VPGRGVLFTFEGIEGSGKTTQMELVAAVLDLEGYRVIRTREPGGTVIGERIRSVLLAAEHHTMAPVTELMLIQACRAQLVREVIRPGLEGAGVILCDRFTDATIAYQGFGRGLDLNLIERLNQVASDGIEPDLTLLFDCPVEVGFQRIARRYGQGKQPETQPGPDRLEAEERAFHERVCEGYRVLASSQGARIRVLDAAGDKETTHRAVMGHIRKALEEKGCRSRRSSARIG
jgi:dTMP kinase